MITDLCAWSAWKLVLSSHTTRVGIDNIACAHQWQLDALVNRIFQALCTAFWPLFLLSGYLCLADNTSVGWSSTSDQMQTYCADFHELGMDNLQLV